MSASNVLAPIITWLRSLRLSVIVRSGLLAWTPLMLVSVALLISTRNFSPLSGVTRLMVKRHALGLLRVHADADEVEPVLGRHRAHHVGTGRPRGSAARQAIAQLVRTLQEDVAQRRAFLLVAELLDRRPPAGPSPPGSPGCANTSLFRISDASLVLALADQLLALGDDPLRAAHHLDVERRRVLGRQRSDVHRIAVPVAEEAVDHAAAVVLLRPMVAVRGPLPPQALRQLVDVLDLVDRHARGWRSAASGCSGWRRYRAACAAPPGCAHCPSAASCARRTSPRLPGRTGTARR